MKQNSSTLVKDDMFLLDFLSEDQQCQVYLIYRT